MQRAGFVLVGGLSSRMGRDKALLPLNSKPLAEHIASVVEQAAGNVVFVGMPERYRGLSRECLPDLHPGAGPLAGIEAALASKRGDLNLIVACDMPGLSPEWLAQLMDQAELTKAACLAATDCAGQVHPLCSVYRSDCLAAVQSAITEKRFRLHDLLKELDAKTFELPVLIPNVNTPEEWALCQQTELVHPH
jgi:molybdenum cofactor guanylyltransferase